MCRFLDSQFWFMGTMVYAQKGSENMETFFNLCLPKHAKQINQFSVVDVRNLLIFFFFFFFCGMTRNISAAFLIFGKKFPKVSFLGFASKIRKYGNIPQPTSHISSGMCVAPLHTLTGPPPPQLQMLKIALGFYESATPSADHGHGAAVPIFALVLFEVVTTPNAILSFAALQLPGAAFQFWKTAENPRRDLHRKCVCTFGVAQAPMWSFGVKRDFFLIFVSSRFFLCVKISCFW